MSADKIANARALIEPLTGHTLRKWSSDLGETYTVRDSHNARLATCSHLTNFGRRPNDEVASNCRLIAAAPALRDTVAELTDLADALAKENDKLRLALGFYASRPSWRSDEEAWDRAEAGDDDPETLDALLSAVELDGGALARAALGDVQ